ncbi:hypothetical protein H101_01732 [Trichophyton interdigitale H6]|nr:hypothetical protein H101_01732 [Trichophyton interdigitale H6]
MPAIDSHSELQICRFPCGSADMPSKNSAQDGTSLNTRTFTEIIQHLDPPPKSVYVVRPRLSLPSDQERKDDNLPGNRSEGRNAVSEERHNNQGTLVPFEGPGRAEDERAEKMPECFSVASFSEKFDITSRSVGPMSRGSLSTAD